jgi:hypothetical protein
MKTRLVEFAGGDGWAEILATIPAHEIDVKENGTPANILEAQFPEDDFTETFEYPIGTTITRIGPGREGVLGRCPDYCGIGEPATGDVLMKVRTQGGVAVDFRVDEYETPRNN